MSLLSVRNLTKKFSGFTAASKISFDVERNRVLGFLGPNGAGKTTILRMLVGLSRPTNGTIEIAGKKVVFGDSRNNTLFGYLPEQPSFYGWMTGYEYLLFVASLFHLDNKKKRIEALLHQVGLERAQNKRIVTFSNGMKQRLGIAQALMNDSELLILDEPVSALDPVGRKEILDIIEQLKLNKTIIMSTHILSDVDRVCDDIIIINQGQLLVKSSLADLKSKYGQPILNVEFAAEPTVELISALKKENWVKDVSHENNKLKITFNGHKDILEENTPLKFFLKANLGITNYGLLLPETEDLFINLLEKK